METLKLQNLEVKPRVVAGHWPTPVEPLTNLSADYGIDLWTKRDDLSGFGYGGNKIRQLEYYVGDALSSGADTLLITGAVQSNFVRATCAFAAKFNLRCHVQLEERVAGVSDLYRKSGNAFLDRLFGADVSSFPVGEDEAAADRSLEEKAEALRARGRKPYIIYLGATHPPIGGYGYVQAAIEFAGQLAGLTAFDAIYVASGSASTHCGLLVGLRALGVSVPVVGICVRRAAQIQRERVFKRSCDLRKLLGLDGAFGLDEVETDDRSFGEGYGKITPMVAEAVRTTARREGLLVDPVYTGRVMAALLDRERASGRRILFWHTGGEPALFAYADKL